MEMDVVIVVNVKADVVTQVGEVLMDPHALGKKTASDIRKDRAANDCIDTHGSFGVRRLNGKYQCLTTTNKDYQLSLPLP